jgi:hypothetical protein
MKKANLLPKLPRHILPIKSPVLTWKIISNTKNATQRMLREFGYGSFKRIYLESD